MKNKVMYEVNDIDREVVLQDKKDCYSILDIAERIIDENSFKFFNDEERLRLQEYCLDVLEDIVYGNNKLVMDEFARDVITEVYITFIEDDGTFAYSLVLKNIDEVWSDLSDDYILQCSIDFLDWKKQGFNFIYVDEDDYLDSDNEMSDLDKLNAMLDEEIFEDMLDDLCEEPDEECDYEDD